MRAIVLIVVVGFSKNAPARALQGPKPSTLTQTPARQYRVEPLHTEPDVLLVRNVLTLDECQALIKTARQAGLERSPVAYAGWSDDVAELLRLAARGPALWAGLGTVLSLVHNDAWSNRFDLAIAAFGAYAATMAIACVAAAAWTWLRRASLQKLRTSTSVALKGDTPAEVSVVRALADVVPATVGGGLNHQGGDPRRMEAVTIIKYAPGQRLAPHFDATRAPEEDRARGGQTLATFLVYLNDVTDGGQTKFGRLPADSLGAPKEAGQRDNNQGLLVSPTAGDACLFFPSAPATVNTPEGHRHSTSTVRYVLDERLEHEGLPAGEDKWLARVWLHEHEVPAPAGLAGTPCADRVLLEKKKEEAGVRVS